MKETNIKKLSLNLHNKLCNDSALVLNNNGLFCLLFLFVKLLLKPVSKSTKCRDVSNVLFLLIHSWVGSWLNTLMVSPSGDVEVNPGPRPKANNTFSACH